MSHLYRDEYAACGKAILWPADWLWDDATLAKATTDDRPGAAASVANPDFVMPSEDEVEREKAPDFKSAIGKRSQNRDVAMILAAPLWKWRQQQVERRVCGRQR